MGLTLLFKEHIKIISFKSLFLLINKIWDKVKKNQGLLKPSSQMPLFSIFAAYNITRKFPDDYISATTILINSEVCIGTYYASSNHPCYVQFYK